ncbi:FAD-dependent oxidoreductase [Cohnella caldifontis]|uniref:FAD-dependent oxidoreductase n=1 Tax=Cohnella caldifontis TaxID=3027471 RepID=UPI0023EDC59F|nr:FAD-dependent oxidoreductase [Cohnella sp. YIM B05605]
MAGLSFRIKLGGVLALVVILLMAVYLWRDAQEDGGPAVKQAKLEPVRAAGPTQSSYDVIVAGTDPEGVMAAVSAARNGLHVLLVDGRDREIFGGLMTLGWLNSLDLNKAPKRNFAEKLTFLDKGLFQEWYDKIEGTSFDVTTAANAFNEMVRAEPNIDVLLKAKRMEPVLSGANVVGLRVEKEDGSTAEIGSKVLIDATQDADLAAAAGVPFTFGREDLGEPDAKMAVTLVFKMSGVTPEIWNSFRAEAKNGFDKMSASGFYAASEYVSSNPDRVKLRGLNVGRQNDGTILLNAMHIYGVDPLDPQSVQEGLEIGRKEAPLAVEYLKKTFKEFRNLQFAGTAPELYVRESRHIEAEYRLTIRDLLENRDAWDAVAYGSYEVDIQSTGPSFPGAVAMKPQAYGVPFRSLVPRKVDGMLVVGRSAGFDSLSHGSARVIPLGMATGQAAGAAAKLAIEKGISVRELSRSKADIAELRKRLVEQGMDLTMPEIQTPDYAKHPEYSGLLAAASMALTYGGYDNKGFALDEASNAQRFANAMSAVKRVYASSFPGQPQDALAGIGDPAKAALTLDQAAYTIALAAGLQVKPDQALDELIAKKWVTESSLALIHDRGRLTNGDSFMLVRDVAEQYVGAKFD